MLERREPDIDLGLAGRRDFMVLFVDRDTGFLQLKRHLIADVLQSVHGRNREITFFRANFVTKIWKLLTCAVPMAFDALDLMK